MVGEEEACSMRSCEDITMEGGGGKNGGKDLDKMVSLSLLVSGWHRQKASDIGNVVCRGESWARPPTAIILFLLQRSLFNRNLAGPRHSYFRAIFLLFFLPPSFYISKRCTPIVYSLLQIMESIPRSYPLTPSHFFFPNFRFNPRKPIRISDRSPFIPFILFFFFLPPFLDSSLSYLLYLDF